MPSIVKTFDGTLAPREQCKYIKGEFYLKDSQCFEIDGRWYRVNSGYIVYDHEISRHVLKNASLLQGIIGIKNGEWETGYFSPNISKNAIVLVNNNEIPCLSDKILKSNGYKELQLEAKDFFVPKAIHESYSKLTRIYPYKRIEDLPYNCYDSIKDAAKLHSLFYIEDKKIDEYSPLIAYGKELKGTYGLEFETDQGRVPKRYLYKLGLMPLRDGSIVGDEYTTIPFSNSTRDLRTLEDICDVLQGYTAFSPNNSLHVHIKTTKFSKNYFVMAYLLNLCIQREIFDMFPKYYEKTSKFKASGKDYNKPLSFSKSELLSSSIIERKDYIDYVFKAAYESLSGGASFADMRESTSCNHPSDSAGNRKWQVDYRYRWCNFIPMLFGGKGTTEYRVHIPTFNINKILSWIFVINGISQYAESLASELDKDKDGLKSILEILSSITLEQIMQSVYSFNLSGLVINYINFRKNLREFMDSQEDYIGILEMENDDVYSLYRPEVLGDSFRKRLDKAIIWDYNDRPQPEPSDELP